MTVLDLINARYDQMPTPTLYASLLVITTVLVVRFLENQKSIGFQRLLAWIPPILFAYIIPACVCAVFNLDYKAVVLHQWSKDFIIPIAILTIMSSMSLKELRIVGSKPLILFVSGSFIIALLPVLIISAMQLYFPETATKFIDGELWKRAHPPVRKLDRWQYQPTRSKRVCRDFRNAFPFCFDFGQYFSEYLDHIDVPTDQTKWSNRQPTWNRVSKYNSFK